MGTCANCGSPIGKLETPKMFRGQPVCAGCFARLRSGGAVTIEQTGKAWKLQIALAALLTIAGGAICFFGFAQHNYGMRNLGAAIGITGFVWELFAQIGAWWFHD